MVVRTWSWTARAAALLALQAVWGCASTRDSGPADEAAAGTASVLPTRSTKPEQRNAALSYWQAIATVPADLAEQAEAIDWSLEVGVISTDEMSEQLLSAATYAAECDQESRHSALAHASTLLQCDFELHFEDGVWMSMPHLTRLRRLAAVIRVEARAALMRGNAERAAWLLTAMLRMAEHASQDRTVISSLTGLRIADMAMQEGSVLARSGEFPAEPRQDLVDAVQRLTAKDPFRCKDAFLNERDTMLEWVIREFKKGPERRRELVAEMRGMPAQTARMAFLWRPDTMTAAQLDESRRNTRHAFEEIVRLWDEPDGGDKLRAFDESMSVEYLGVGGLVLPSGSSLWWRNSDMRVSARSLLGALGTPALQPATSP